MNQWLPDSFEPPQSDERIARTLDAVRTRSARRDKTIRAAQWTAGAAAVFAVAFFLAPKVNHREVGPQQMAGKASGGAEEQRDRARETGRQGNRESEAGSEANPAPAPLAPHPVPQSPSPLVPSSPPHPLTSSLPHGPAEVTLSKNPKGVELTWKGNPNEDYIVYRCTTPRFDQCDVAGVVKGTKWTDREADRAPLVFYKIEPKG